VLIIYLFITPKQQNSARIKKNTSPHCFMVFTGCGFLSVSNSWMYPISSVHLNIPMSPWLSVIISGQQSSSHCRCCWSSASALFQRDHAHCFVTMPFLCCLKDIELFVCVSPDRDVLVNVSSWTENFPFLLELLWTLIFTALTILHFHYNFPVH